MATSPVDWDADFKPPLPPKDLSPEDVKDFTPAEYKSIGQVEADVLEAMLVGYLLHDEDIEGLPEGWEARNADVIAQSGIEGDWFEDSSLGEAFDLLLTWYRTRHHLLSAEDAATHRRTTGMAKDKAAVYQSFLKGCQGAVFSRKIRIEILVKMMCNRHFLKTTHELFRRFTRDYSDEKVGPERALDQFKRACVTRLSNPGQGALRQYNWVADYESTIGWLKDMKRNPDKYRGFLCNIPTLDERTNGGFRPGHLTVLVGRPGGYKTTLLLNMAYGFWSRGYNVLYASLEMEARLMELKLWCRATGRIDYSRLYGGKITEPEDPRVIEEMRKRLSEDPPKDKKQREDLEDKILRMEDALKATEKQGKFDVEILQEYEASIKGKPNQLRIINVGQSSKIKISQIERYLLEVESAFRPQVVIVDYLSFVASENAYPDRRDLELGDICNYLRNLGEMRQFSVITAAQFKRAALERIRKYGEGSPEKAQLGTDDISESHQISAVADTIIMLWPLANHQLKILFPKARHGIVDTSEGKVLEVDDARCLISEDIQKLDGLTSQVDMFSGMSAVNEVGEMLKSGKAIPSMDPFEEMPSGAHMDDKKEDQIPAKDDDW